MFKRLVVLLIVMVCLVSFSYAKKPVKLMDKDMSEIQGAFLPVVLPIMPTAPVMEPLNAVSSLLEKNKRTVEYAGIGAGMLAIGLAAPEVGLPLAISLYTDSVMCRRQNQKTFDECMDERISDTLGITARDEGIGRVSKPAGNLFTGVGLADDASELSTNKKLGDALAYSGGVKVYIKSLDKTCTLVDKDKVVCPTDTPRLTSNPPTGNGCDTITQQTFVKDELGIWRQPGVTVSNGNAAQVLPFKPVYPTEKCEFEIPSGTKTSCYPKVTSRKTTSSGGSGSSSLLGRITSATKTAHSIAITNPKANTPVTYTVDNKTYTGLQDASGQGTCVAPQNVTCAPNLLNTPATLNPLAPAAQNQVCVVNTGTTTAKKTTSHSDGGSPAPSSTGGTPKTTTAAPPVATAKPTTPVKNTSGYGSNPSGTVQKAAGTVVPANKSLKDYSPAEARAISNR